MFQTTKIQTFESNSQPDEILTKFESVVSDYKDTNFWEQFTTTYLKEKKKWTLFQTTKIQTFESNSQHTVKNPILRTRCFRLQRYKLLKAIHNAIVEDPAKKSVVSDYKDTNFWKQFTTPVRVIEN